MNGVLLIMYVSQRYFRKFNVGRYLRKLMESIVLARESNFEDIEILCGLIDSNPNANLRIPNSLKESGVFGLEGLVIQTVANWFWHSGSRVLHTYYSNPGEENFSDLSSSAYGICVLRFADRIITSQEKIDIERAV